MWGRVKKKLRKDQMPGNGPNGESIVYADFRRNQPIYVSDETGDGWSHCRFLAEETVTIKKEDGTEVVETKTPSSVFASAMIPTSFFDPHPEWSRGQEPKTGLPDEDEQRERDNIWSRDERFQGRPEIPSKAVKRTRDPQDTKHTDLAPQYLVFKLGDRVVYGTTAMTGTIIDPGHPMLSAWNILPDQENATPITLPTAEFEAFDERNE